MKKVQYDHQPLKLEAVGNGSYLYRWGIEKKTNTDDLENNSEIWECYEALSWKDDRQTVTEAAIEVLRKSANNEAKLINDYNAANAGLLDKSYKQAYLDYIARLKSIKADIKNFFKG